MFADAGGVSGTTDGDGLRFTTAAGEIVHFRTSGNAPEVRIYVEAISQARAAALLEWARRHVEAYLA